MGEGGREGGKRGERSEEEKEGGREVKEKAVHLHNIIQSREWDITLVSMVTTSGTSPKLSMA